MASDVSQEAYRERRAYLRGVGGALFLGMGSVALSTTFIAATQLSSLYVVHHLPWVASILTGVGALIIFLNGSSSDKK